MIYVLEGMSAVLQTHKAETDVLKQHLITASEEKSATTLDLQALRLAAQVRASFFAQDAAQLSCSPC